MWSEHYSNTPSASLKIPLLPPLTERVQCLQLDIWSAIVSLLAMYFGVRGCWWPEIGWENAPFKQRNRLEMTISQETASFMPCWQREPPLVCAYARGQGI